MTIDPHDAPMAQDGPEMNDEALDALIRRADRGVPTVQRSSLEARIMSQAAFPLASRRRTARSSTADTLAAWVRVAIPLAAAAAIFAAISLTTLETGTVADAELRESDPAALLSALESDGSSGLAHHIVASDVDETTEAAGAR